MAGLSLKSVQTSAAVEPKQPRLTKTTVVAEFARYFGSEDKLENWQRLCRDVGIEDVPGSITKCRLALRKFWVNIYDLIEAVRQNKIPHRFPSEKALRKYTISKHKVFPKEEAKEGGPVRALLANIFQKRWSRE
ncbi:hypothetical protein BKA61DRAFT_680265 [Leptodontidium sp. MPI-SDFR-AT-0119]|nr:hypothetical protein BKA61DRAFT_680265 [Leptodontidium sp. MPI-SDFR-AT-0119]